MKKQQRQRRSAIIAELSRLSRDGWANARPCDYQPLEAELRALEQEMERRMSA
jgi:hypothetical protein